MKCGGSNKSVIFKWIFITIAVMFLLGFTIDLLFFKNINQWFYINSCINCKIDSLNKQAYNNRYCNLDSTFHQAQLALSLSDNYSEGKAVALNNLGFYAFMKMDFDKATQIYQQVHKTTRNEIELLIADIGLMKVCQRTSQNKEFYDYRTNATRRMLRIQDDRQILDSVELARFIYAETEFHIVSSIYYFYLQQEEQSLEEINSINSIGEVRLDTAQWLYYLYMKGSGGLCEGKDEIEVSIKEFDYLIQCLQMSREGGYLYFEANSLQAFAELLIDPIISELLYANRPIALNQIKKSYNFDNNSFLPIEMARKALGLFKIYNDVYQIAGTYRTIASCLIQQEKYEEALDSLTKALNYVNIHHQTYYQCSDSTHQLHPYIPNEKTSLEMHWMNTPEIQTVPEWILRIREQLSLAYAGLNQKMESDYNRNIYLDLLEFTRQDKELESRYGILDRELNSLNKIIFITIIGLVCLILLFGILNSHWKKRNKQQINLLRHTLDICRRIIISIPQATKDTEEMMQAIAKEVEPDFKELFKATSVSIHINNVLSSSATNANSSSYIIHLPLIVPYKINPIGFIEIVTLYKLTRDERALIRIIAPYFAWAIENGNNLILLGDEHRRLEKERYIHQQHIADNKKENIVKRTCLSIVTGITPFIDRIMHETNKLKQLDDVANTDNNRIEKYQYLNELISKIIDYNEILSLWIKVKQGSLKLNIESFPLAELFKILAKSRQSFEMKNQNFIIDPTAAYIKADKALTLFMINTLIENARKYTSKGGIIHVSSIETDKYVEISVTDNGPGISSSDIRRILDEKFYDSSTIGQDSDFYEELKEKKGSGFGIMNCKGIIEKYRKTNELFQVCIFNIESQIGEGSRFYFRLPKGFQRIFSILVVLFISIYSLPAKIVEQSANVDSLLESASFFADEAYYSNIDKNFDQALIYIDSAIIYLNTHYKIHNPTDTLNILTLIGKGKASEIEWLYKDFDTDYYIILDIRNEAAVAFLALRQWENYRYNNNAYTRLYKLVSEDKSLEAYCRQMLRSSSNRTVGIIICVLLVIICIVAYYVLYLRRKFLYRLNLEQVFEINRSVFAASIVATYDSNKDFKTGKSVVLNNQENMEAHRQIPYKILELIWNGINELFSINALAIAVCNKEGGDVDFSFYPGPDEMQKESLVKNLIRCIDKYNGFFEDSLYLTSHSNAIHDDKCLYLPLLIDAGKTHHCIGAIAICRQTNEKQESDILLAELVVGFISIVILNSVIKPAVQYDHIETVQDETRRALHEETQLHVQNLVLDNCLSTIKHETIYYPSRIKQILQQLLLSTKKEQELISDMSELISYYKDIFTLLSSCAARQLEEITFRRTSFNVAHLIEEHTKVYFKKSLRRENYIPETSKCPVLKIECPDLYVVGDYNELCFLFENLIDEALAFHSPGTFLLKVTQNMNFARFDFIDTRRVFSQEELNMLFSPDHLKNTSNSLPFSEGTLHGTEFLICKQIIREHDEYMGHPGCRINAEKIAQDEGFAIWFTIPLQKNK